MTLNTSKSATKKQRHIIDKIAIDIFKIIVIFVVFVQFILPIYISYRMIYKNRKSFDKTPEYYGLKYDEVEYKTKDNLILKGWFLGHKNKSPGILLIHDVGENRSELLKIGNFLFKNGYSVLLFDMHGHGMSDGGKVTFGKKEINDIEASLRFLSQQKYVDENTLGIYGIGFGSSFAILGVGESQFLRKYTKVLVLDTPYARLTDVLKNHFLISKGYLTPIPEYVSRYFLKIFICSDIFRNEPIDIIKEIEIPVLFIHGAEDMIIPKEESEELYKHKIFGQKSIWLIPLSSHLEGVSNFTKEYKKNILKFLKNYLN